MSIEEHCTSSSTMNKIVTLITQEEFSAAELSDLLDKAIKDAEYMLTNKYDLNLNRGEIFSNRNYMISLKEKVDRYIKVYNQQKEEAEKYIKCLDHIREKVDNYTKDLNETISNNSIKHQVDIHHKMRNNMYDLKKTVNMYIHIL